MIISLLCSLIVMSLIVSILKIMDNHELKLVSQVDVFEQQFQQYLIRNSISSCTNDNLEFKDVNIFEHKNRIVKKGGYEILLDNISNLEFVCGDVLGLKFMHDNQENYLEFKLP